MSAEDVLNVARLSYGADDFFIEYEEYQQGSTHMRVSNDVRNKLQKYLSDWDQNPPVIDSAIETYPDNLELIDAYYDTETGTSGIAFKNTDTGKVYVGYSGTNPSTDPYKDSHTDGRQILNMRGEHIKPARDFYRRVRGETNVTPILTGHSLGVNIAQLVAIFANVPEAYGFNPAPAKIEESSRDVAFNLINQIGFDRLQKFLEEDKSRMPIKGAVDGIQAPYNREFYNELMIAAGKYNGNMTFFASGRDVLSQGVLGSDLLLGTSRNFFGTWVIMERAGWHLMPELYLKPNFEKIKRFFNSNKEWQRDGVWNVLDIDGKMIVQKVDTSASVLKKETKTGYAINDHLYRLFQTLDNFHDMVNKWKETGPLSGSQAIFVDLEGTRITTLGLKKALEIQLTDLQECIDRYSKQMNNNWEQTLASIETIATDLDEGEIEEAMSSVGVNKQSTLTARLDELKIEKEKVEGKVNQLTRILSSINESIVQLDLSDQLIAKQIEF